MGRPPARAHRPQRVRGGSVAVGVPRSCRRWRHGRRLAPPVSPRAERWSPRCRDRDPRAINPVDGAYGLGKSKVDDSDVGDHRCRARHLPGRAVHATPRDMLREVEHLVGHLRIAQGWFSTKVSARGPDPRRDAVDVFNGSIRASAARRSSRSSPRCAASGSPAWLRPETPGVGASTSTASPSAGPVRPPPARSPPTARVRRLPPARAGSARPAGQPRHPTDDVGGVPRVEAGAVRQRVGEARDAAASGAAQAGAVRARLSAGASPVLRNACRRDPTYGAEGVAARH